MIKVRCILVETTFPVRIRPRIETIPVNGHFLSAKSRCQHSLLLDLNLALCMDVGRTRRHRPISRRQNQYPYIPIYEPSIAVLGVLKPSPTSLNHLRPPFPTFDLDFLTLLLRKI